MKLKKGNYIFTPNRYHKNSRLLPTVEMRNSDFTCSLSLLRLKCFEKKKPRDDNLDLLAELKVLTQKVTKRLNRRAGRKERGRGRERGKEMVFVQ